MDKDKVDELILAIRREVVGIRSNRPGPLELVPLCERMEAQLDALEAELNPSEIPASDPATTAGEGQAEGEEGNA